MSPTILERRDVAVVPSLAIAGASLMAAVALLLRPAPGTSIVMALSFLALSIAGGAVALTIDRPTATRLRARPAAHLCASLALTAGLGGVAMIDGGTGNAIFTACVAVATYIGLVLPKRLALIPLAWMLAIVLLIALAGPAHSTLNATIIAVLIAAGWALGRLGNVTHEQAARQALIASRSDRLTGMLNRRGFFEHFHFELHDVRRAGQPVSVLALDLNGFKIINDRDGHAAGDDILRWVGVQLAGAVPRGATVGRLGGDEFGVLLPGLPLEAAEALALKVKAALAPRIGVAIGATGAGRKLADADELLRVADEAMYVDKRGVAGARTGESIARGGTRSASPLPPAMPQPPPVTYGQAARDYARRENLTPAKEATALHILNTAGTSAIVLCALGLGYVTVTADTRSDYDDLLRDAALPWVLANVALALGSLGWQTGEAFRSRWRWHYAASAALLGAVLWVGMLAGPAAGLESPLVGAMFLKIIYDGFALEESDARLSGLAIMGWWLAVAVMGPATALWVVPFQLAMFGASWAVGRVAHRAHADLTDAMLALAESDPLTGLRNRAGFESDLARALADAPQSSGVLAVLGLDLDDFKAINDQQGHDMGDRVLRGVADILRAQLHQARSIARIGGDEFVAVLTVPDAAASRLIVGQLARELESVVGASVGYAVLGVDGDDAGALTKVADRRSYEAKRARRAARGAAAVSQAA